MTRSRGRQSLNGFTWYSDSLYDKSGKVLFLVLVDRWDREAFHRHHLPNPSPELIKVTLAEGQKNICHGVYNSSRRLAGHTLYNKTTRVTIKYNSTIEYEKGVQSNQVNIGYGLYSSSRRIPATLGNRTTSVTMIHVYNITIEYEKSLLSLSGKYRLYNIFRRISSHTLDNKTTSVTMKYNIAIGYEKVSKVIQAYVSIGYGLYNISRRIPSHTLDNKKAT